MMTEFWDISHNTWLIMKKSMRHKQLQRVSANQISCSYEKKMIRDYKDDM